MCIHRSVGKALTVVSANRNHVGFGRPEPFRRYASIRQNLIGQAMLPDPRYFPVGCFVRFNVRLLRCHQWLDPIDRRQIAEPSSLSETLRKTRRPSGYPWEACAQSDWSSGSMGNSSPDSTTGMFAARRAHNLKLCSGLQFLESLGVPGSPLSSIFG